MPNSTTSTLTAILIAVVLAGTCLLISAPRGEAYGAQPWVHGSVLKQVVDAMALYYKHPTPATVDIKGLILGLGASVAVAIGAVGWFGATRREPDGGTKFASERAAPAERDRAASRISDGAQLAMLAFVVVMLLSRFWSHAPRYTLYAAILVAIQIGWALALARTVTLSGVLAGVVTLVSVLAVTAVIGIWYHHERNPVVELKFPIGNPLFLGACLIPGLILAPSLVLGLLASRSGIGSVRKWLFVVLLVAALVSLGWAFSLTGARSAQGGLLAGLLAFSFFASRSLKRPARRIITVVLLVVVLAGAIGAVSWLKARAEDVTHSQGASLRVRFYSWRYAIELFTERPLVGHGRGTYPLLAEARAAEDVLADPMAFFGRAVGHAHQEWLETLVEGGVLGIGLLVLAYGLTFLAGARALRRGDLQPIVRWSLVGLLTALTAMMVEECADVALRVEAFPAVYFTVLGLIWALLGSVARDGRSAGTTESDTDGGRTNAVPVRLAGLGAGLIVATLMIHYTVTDWYGAQDLGAAPRAFERGEIEQGVGLTASAAEARLDSIRRLEANIRGLETQADIVYFYLQQAMHRLNELSSGVEQIEMRLQVIAEDLLRAGFGASQALAIADALNQVAPGFERIATAESRLAALGGQAVALAHQFAPRLEPLRSTAATDSATARVIEGFDQLIADPTAMLRAFQGRSVAALDRLVRRTPYNEGFALMLWRSRVDQPMAEQIVLFLRLLRAGWVSTNYRSALAELASREGFTEAFTPMVADARREAEASTEDTKDVGQAPDVLRLAALLAENDQRAAESVALAERAAELYRALASRFPLARVAALTDLARLRLHADPNRAAEAVRAARQALEAAAPWNLREAALEPVRIELILDLLAAGDEQAAAHELSVLIEHFINTRIDRQPAQHAEWIEIAVLSSGDVPNVTELGLGAAYAELVAGFLDTPDDRKPSAFAGWIERALALNPAFPGVQEVRARWSIQRKRGRDVVNALRRILDATGAGQEVDTLVQLALTQLPDDPDVRAFAQERNVTTQPTTAPAP